MVCPMIYIVVTVILPYVQNKTPAWKVNFYISLGYANAYLLLGWLFSIMKVIRTFSQRLIDDLKVSIYKKKKKLFIL
jgi:hypothetical protein